MAPEQWRGQAEAASDQYSLGCLLFELLTGQTPFAGGSPEHYLMLHQTQQAPSLRQVNGGVPRDLETICLKCLEKEPGRRYADCQELADDLRRWLVGEPIQARPIGRWERVMKWVRRNPLVAAMTASVALLLLLLAAGASVTAIWLRAERDAALANLARAEAAESDAREQSRAAREAEQIARERLRVLGNLDAGAVKGHEYARAGQWAKATDIFKALVDEQPEVYVFWIYAAALQAQAGNQEAYRRLCRKMLERFGSTSDLHTAERIVKACCLMPGVFEEGKELVALADLVVTRQPNHPDMAWFCFAKGLAEYRIGRHVEAADWLAKSLKKPPGLFAEASAQLVLAMTQQQQGQADAAKNTLTRAKATIARLPPPGIVLSEWYDSLITDLLRREAESLILGQARKVEKK
jgi:tetratricopeptide (TPR) repeat protein